MAGRRIYPEFRGCGDYSPNVAGFVVEWLKNEERRLRIVGILEKLKRLYAIPGAGDAAAAEIVDLAGLQRPSRMAG